MYGLYDDTLRISDCEEWATCKWLTGNNVQWSKGSLISERPNITAFASRNWDTPRRRWKSTTDPRTDIWKRGHTGKKPECYSIDRDVLFFVVRIRVFCFIDAGTLLTLSPRHGATSGCEWTWRPLYVEGSCDHLVQGVARCQHSVVLQLGSWTKDWKILTLKSTRRKCYT